MPDITIFDDENVRRIRRELRRHATAGTTPEIELLRNAAAAGLLDDPPEVAEPAEDDLTLESLTVAELTAMAQELEIDGRSSMNKTALIAAIRER